MVTSKKRTKNSKIQHSTGLLTTLAEVLPVSIHSFLRVNVLCKIPDMSFEIVPLIRPVLTKTTKKKCKEKKMKII